MIQRRKAVVWVVALSIACSLIILHAVRWHTTGMYLEMFGWLETGKGYITVLYNLGIMLALGAGLGLLLENITDLLGYEIHEIKHFDEDEAGEGQ